MHALKGFIIVIFGLIILMALFSLLMPSKVMMVKTTTIAAHPDSVYLSIRDLKKWPAWHPALQSPEQNWTVTQNLQGPLKATWSENWRTQSLQIASDSGRVWQASLLRTNEKPLDYIITVSPSQSPGQTEVEWRVIQNLGWWPWDKFGGMVMDKMAGPGYELALKSLKDFTEQKH